MKAQVSWWDLKDSEQTVESLRAHLGQEGLGPWPEVQGLVVKFWISDTENGRFGAIQIWADERPPLDQLPPNRMADLIGYRPTDVFVFDVEASAEGAHGLAGLTGHGLALAGTPAGAGVA